MKIKNLINKIRNAFGFPTVESVFGNEGIPHDGPAYVKGKRGATLEKLPVGTYFAVVGKENYPKVKLEGTEEFPIGYYDLSFQIKNFSGNPEWETVVYTEEEVREIFRKKNVSADKIDVILKNRRSVDHDGQL